jgi:CheY-like chemotaxis protein
MDGIQTLKTIRQSATTKDIPVIALTARAMFGDREELLSQGFNEYVSKPIDPEELAKTVRRCIYGD